MNKIDVEESLKFVDLGILVLVNEAGKKFYMRPKSTNDPKFPFELIPLTSSELKSIGVEESEAHSEGEQIDVEESVHELSEEEKKWTEQEAKKYKEEWAKKNRQHSVNMNDPESVAAAKSILDKQLSKLQEPEKLREENEDLKGKLQLAAEVAFDRKKRELGCTDADIDTPDKLLSWEKGKSGRGSGSPSGSAPLQSDYHEFAQNNDLLKKVYPDSKTMVEDVRSRARMGDQTAQKVLDKWTQNFIENKKRNPQQPDVFYDPNSKEALEELRLRKLGEWLTPEGESDPFDLKKNFRERNRKRLQKGVET